MIKLFWICINKLRDDLQDPLPKYEEQWLKEFFEQSVKYFMMGDLTEKKIEDLKNKSGRILISENLVNSPKFHLIKEMFSFELNHSRDHIILGLVQDPGSPNYFFEFYVFIALLDYFKGEEFSRIIKHTSEELLRNIIEEESPLFFEKESASHDILIKTNNIDAFLNDKFTFFEKIMVAEFLHYKQFLTMHPSESILSPAYFEKLIQSWKMGEIINLGKLTPEAYDYIEKMMNKKSSFSKHPRFSKKTLFWNDLDFVPALIDVLEKRGLRYLERLSDKGSTAILYKALDPYTEEKCAIKVYMRVGKDIEREFYDIRDQLQRIKNPYIIKLISDGHFNFKDEEIFYFVEEYIDGKSLDVISEEILFSKGYSDRIKLTYMLADALEAVHSAYEAHNDLHEGNILIVNDPLTLKIIDPRSSLHSPAAGSPDFKDFFTLLSRFLTNDEKKKLGISLVDQDSASFSKFKERLITQNEIAEIMMENESKNLLPKKSEAPRFRVELCSLTTENFENYLKNAMDNAAHLNHGDWPHIYCGQKISIHPQCIKDENDAKIENAIGGKKFGKDWCLLGFSVGNISDKVAKNVAFRAVISDKLNVLSWDDVYYTMDNKLDGDKSIYKIFWDDELGTIIECSLGNLTNRVELVQELLLIRVPSTSAKFNILSKSYKTIMLNKNMKQSLRLNHISWKKFNAMRIIHSLTF